MKFSSFAIVFLLLAGPTVMVAGELEDALENLKQAEAQKDVAQVKKLALETYGLVSQVVNSPAPESAEEKQHWTNRVTYAKEIGLHVEYALYSVAVQSPRPAMIDLIATLEKVNPKSQYLDAAYGPYLVALSQAGSAAQVPAIADKALQNFPENEELLLVVADNAMARKAYDRALNCANRLTNALGKHSKPEGVAAADWERRRTAMLGRGYWIAGVIQAERNLYVPADTALRAALPLIQGNNDMMGPALFYLGLVNYQIAKLTMNRARMNDSTRFSQQAAQISGPYSQQAWHNALVSKREAATMR